ncbi:MULTISPECIES: tyrosine-type recombinase/integrase [Vibrio]|uniref:tyrosine-type recombinase/integrase n=1 Tax=Vibrio TaxID=662 RepID=UPI0020950B53|nr:site-specific integrase [Vibrio paracholerae]MCO7066786.1 site-specific integrase [Vibrio paracholerae]HDB1444088.1 site-specific integrase [Vibrio cholerae]
MLRLVKTSSDLNIYPRVAAYIDEDAEPQFATSGTPNKYKGVRLLFDDNESIYIANAFILYRRISLKLKDTSTAEKALKAFFVVLKENHLQWDKHLIPNDDDNPLFVFKSVLSALIDSGQYTGETAKNYLGAIRAFYKFLHQHFYIKQLPYNMLGTSRYGKELTDCTITVASTTTNLRPIKDEYLDLIFKHLSLVPLEARLAMLLSLFSGLRRFEAITLTKRHVFIPNGFKGETLTNISISPKTGVHTKRSDPREISIPLRVCEIFEQYHNSLRYKKRLEIWLELEDTDSELDHPALLNRNGEIYKPDTINRYWSIIANEVMCDDPRFNHIWHHLRVTFGCRKMSTLLDKGFSYSQAIALLKSEMGHKHISTTQLYLTHWEHNSVSQEVIDVMGDMVEKIMGNDDLWGM